MHKSFEVVLQPEIKVNPAIIQYAEKHGKKAAYLLNNRLFFNIINPKNPIAHKEQYTINWNYINSL